MEANIAPTAPIIPAGLAITPSVTPGYRSPSEIAAGVPPKLAPISEPTKPEPEPEKTAEAPKPAAKKAAAKKAKAKPAAERKPRTPPLPMAKRFEIMKLISEARPTETDADLADKASALCDRAVAVSLIASYRLQLTGTSVKEPSKAELRQRLAELQRKLEELQQPSLDLSHDEPMPGEDEVAGEVSEVQP